MAGSMKTRRKLAYRRQILISSVATGLLASTAPAMAGCVKSGSSWQCDYGSADAFTTIQGVSEAGYSPPHDNGTTDAGAGPNVTINDSGANFTVSSGFDTYRGVLYGQSFGGQGEDAGKGGGAGKISISSSGKMAVDVNGSEDSSGNVAVSTPRAFVTGISQGGDGEQDDNDDNDSNGGAGANGNDVTVTVNSAAQYTLDGTIVRNFEGVLAQSGGGAGGRQNSALFDNQHGGTGGTGQLAKVSNSGSIRIGAQAPIQSSADLVSGIRAWSFGGYGGRHNGNAGAGGTVEVDHNAGAELQLSVNTKTAGQEIYGIMADSEGAQGYYSEDNDDRGGQGGGAGDVTVNVGSGISVDVTGAGVAHGAAVHAASRGGKGGTGPNGNTGGDGGTAGAVTVALERHGSDFAIATSGTAVNGVIAISRGGEGGDGADNTAVAGRAGGGGFGGDGGEVQVNADAGIRITTSGDFASGIVAMSLGGGGGTGGEFTGIIGGGAGNGGNGGDAGNVEVFNHADIDTQGQHAYGIVAQSISGGGGAGGVAAGLVLTVGGDGQAGGTPGDVTVANTGTITTAGFGSFGILAQSIADGGGAAGGAGGVFAIGGNADSSHDSDAGKASAANSGIIVTTGDAAKGMLVQSVGGGGGSGAGAVGVLGVGGQGQAGGNGGVAEITALGAITTSGEFAHGAEVQSIGGGGGDGGSVFDVDVVAGIGVGGVGAGGGDGGAVTVSGTEQANIVTAGYGAIGLLAHSVGNGGGSGGNALGVGLADLTFQVGGDGGGSGSGGAVTVDRSNLNIETAGGMATGLHAQSVGGGGGVGGGVMTDTLSIEVALNISVGGDGGVAGDGGEVKVALDNSSITTTGSAKPPDDAKTADNATAILAQSIGGGGGSGGSSMLDNVIAGIPTEVGGVSIPINLTMGGQGGAGGNGAAVTVDLSNTALQTYGQFSRGVHAQSVGGGGGNGGDSSVYSLALDAPGTLNVQFAASVGGDCDDDDGCPGGDGDQVDVALHSGSNITTAGDYASGILAQSVGGGGGSGGAAYASAYQLGSLASVQATVGVGAKGGVGGNGDLVNVNLDSNTYIFTTGSGARGILAQSIGGGGGESQGVSTLISAGGKFKPGESVMPSLTAEVSVGRNGVGGGDGAATTVSNAGIISTKGRNSDGIMAQSIGGGGGVGGSVGADHDWVLDSVSSLIKWAKDDIDRWQYNLGGWFTVGVGGAGGAGGKGGDVSVVNRGDISTQGDYADGIVAQSIGGGGGEGGAATADGANSLFTGEVAVGGSGGNGGQGGLVDVKLIDGSSILTQGSTAYGVLAQSIGGGGGMGNIGSAVFGGSFNIGSGVGGSGGDGTDGNSVTFSASGDNLVQTLGDGSHGVVLQSIGNGGGVGGTGDFGNNAWVIDYSMVVAVGGHGGNAGNGGTVSACGYESGCGVVNISTSGDQAAGLIAQSIGGGGGMGGVTSTNQPVDYLVPLPLLTAVAGLEVGGRGGAGGDGGSVSVDGSFAVSTLGDFSPALLAQSIGGGGGLGGTHVESSTAFNATTLTLKLGGRDGTGGDGGVVVMHNDSQVVTQGDGSHGMVAQSIGGGGGLAGAMVKPPLDDSDQKDLLGSSSLGLYVGGDPDSTGSGVGNSNPLKEQDAISMAATGTIMTSGDWAMGMLAQAIGGGGGASFVGWKSGGVSSPTTGSATVGGGEGSVGYGGDIALQLGGPSDTGIVTRGNGAYGILAQSIGGGGGLAAILAPGTGIKQNVGGTGTSGAADTQSGGQVRLTGAKTILTGGDDAHGVVLQSIGGGGGVSGMSLPADGGSVAGDIVVGGTQWGDGRTVTVDNAVLRIGTDGDRAFGLVAQSIGGGGGIATGGAGVGLSLVTLGNPGEAYTLGGDVNVSLANGTRIYTRGRGSHGLVAQSIGGGGGIAGDPSIAPLGIEASAAGTNPAAGGGDGGTVSLSVDGDIVTTGEHAFGILAQSIGGGGGLGGDSSTAFAGSSGSASGSADIQGKGGMIHLTQNGNVSATGNDSVGIFAQSQGPSADGGIDFTIYGNVAGGSGAQGAGIWMVGGNQNWLAVQAGARVSAASGVAIRYDGTRAINAGSVATVQNDGVIDGDIVLHALDSDHAGTVNNQGQITGAVAAKAAAPASPGGVLVGARRYDANVVNDGTLIVGRHTIVDSTAISGDFTQGGQGTLLVNADFGRRSADRLHVQGDARLDGTLDVAALSLLPGRRVTVLTVDGDATGQLSPRQSPIFDYTLNRDGKNYQLSVDGADFDAPALGLGSRQAALAGHLQEIWDAGAPGPFGKLFASVDNMAAQGSGGYRQLLSNLSPDVMLAPATQMQSGMMRFGRSLMSCPTFTGADAMTGESECVWGQVSHRDARQDSQGDAAGFSSDSTTYQVGAQKQVAPHWFVGVSAAYQNDSLRGDGGRVGSKGDSGFLGVALKHEIGPWLLAAGISGSYGNYDTERQIGVDGFGRSASSDPDVYGGAARLRVARTFAFPSFYLKPYMDVDAVYARMPGYQEKGSDLALKVEGSDQFTFAFSPTLEVGGRVDLKGATLRPFAYAGATFLTDDEWKTKARFAGAPDGSRGFQTSLPIDDSVARVGAGLQISTQGGVDVRLQYEGEFSGHTSSNSGFLKVAVPF